MQLIDGKAISELVKQEIAAEVAEIVAKGGKRPHLAAILVGHDGGSETYIARKTNGHTAYIDRVKTIHIFPIVNGFNHFLLGNMFRQRELYNETIHVSILIQFSDLCQ